MKIAGLILGTLLTLYFIVGQPLLGSRRYRAFRKKVAVDLFVRERYYLTSIRREWLWFVLVGIIITLTSAPLADFGLDAPYDWGTTLILIAVGLVSIGGGLIIIILRLKTTGKTRLVAGLAPVRDLLPHTARERGLWIVLSISAGVCEEVVFRGFLPWYFLQIGTLAGWQFPFWTALVLSTLIFGLIHAYQGKRGILLTVLLGALFAYCYAITGSLLLPIILHALIGVRNGFIAPLLLDLWKKQEEAAAAATSDPA